MLNVDEFESVFRAADKKTFRYAPPSVSRALLVSDLEGERLDAYAAAAAQLIAPMGAEIEWVRLETSTIEGVEALLDGVESVAPDLIVTYRNLESDAWRFDYSLGVYLNALTRGTRLPVVVTPHPAAQPEMAWKERGTDSVVVITDHLTGDDALVNWGVRATRAHGALHLVHVEHDEIFERFVSAVAKVPEIETDLVREKVLEQLLREPKEYIATCKRALAEAGHTVQVYEHVVLGHRVEDYRRFIEENEVEMLVFPTLEEDRVALQGVAYSLAVEMVDFPLLMV